MAHDLPPTSSDASDETVRNDPERTQAYMPPPDDTTRPYTPDTHVIPSQQLPSQPTQPQPTQPQPTQPQPTQPRGQHVQSAHHVQRSQPPRRMPQSRQMPPARRPKQQAKESTVYLPWWSLVFMLLIVMFASFLIVGSIYFLGGTGSGSATQEPIIRVITAAVTDSAPANSNIAITQPPSTQVITSGDASDLNLTGPTLVPVQFTPTPQPITVGSSVVVSGVGDQELNVRDQAGVLTSSVLFRSDEGVRFIVVDGPTQADGFTWWQIQDAANAGRVGWAVANYLQVVPSDASN